MSVKARLTLSFAVATGVLYLACGSDDGAPAGGPTLPDRVRDGGSEASDASDPRCATQAMVLDTHPHALDQPTPLGKTISDVRGFNGSVYLAYGDLEANTGPIYITSWEPSAKAWKEHPVSYREEGTGLVKTTPAFATHDIEHFDIAADKIWAPAAQVQALAPVANSPPEYAVGSASGDWAEADISSAGLHLIDVLERAPGDLYLTGSGIMQTDASTAANGRAGGFIWRSQNGGPFTQLFPDFTVNKPGEEFFDLTGAFMRGAALNGIAYIWSAGFIYKYNGTTWDFQEDFGEFLRPQVFLGQLVFADLGQMFSFDGTTRHNLDFRFFESKGHYNAMKEPLALFQVSEGRLLAVEYGGDVMMTTDLTTWTCIGKAPADASAIGSLDGIVYFGSVDSRLYAFPARSW